MEHPSRDRILYVGGYASSDEPGIHILVFDSTVGRLHVVGSVAGIDNPSFLALRRQTDTLYAVSESEAGAEVVALRVGASAADTAIVGRQACSGSGPCHIAVSPSGRYALAASYRGGSVSVFPLSEAGGLGPEMQYVPHSGPNGVTPAKDGHSPAPHPHQVVFSPSGRNVCVPDLGLDRVYVYHWDEHNGQLLFRHAHRLSDGAGPRHMAYHPDRPYVYTINELDSTVSAFTHPEDDDGAWRHLQTVTSLPVGFMGENSTADIHIDRAGAFLYASNRGHDSIAVFAINRASGRLDLVQHTPTGGQTPRNFALAADDKFMIVANQNSSALGVFRRDATTGTLRRTAYEAPVPRPTCIVG